MTRVRPGFAGTLHTARLALQHGLAVNTAGGTHHAFPSHGSGFCILNDLAITAETLRAEGRVSRILIFDLDVHQVLPCSCVIVLTCPLIFVVTWPLQCMHYCFDVFRSYTCVIAFACPLLTTRYCFYVCVPICSLLPRHRWPHFS